MPRPDGGDPVGRAGRFISRRLASGTTRRSFLAGVGAAALALVGAGSADAARRPATAAERRAGTARIKGGWFGFCGHTWTTASCPAPYNLPRIDARGYPVRPGDGRPIDNLGRLVDALGRPIAADGRLLTGPDGAPLPRAPRTRLCEDQVPERFGVDAVTQGAWYRCCNGQIRKLTDCCSTSRRRINGDASLVGYCRPGRRVYCVLYIDTGVPC
ncbi:MAG: hypothetical protein AB7V42_07555 [Thermoleophilia bacterium]